MRFGISEKELQTLRDKFPQGCRVELIKMEDPYRKIPVGTKGTVKSVDDIGTIHVHWDTGSHLGIAYGEDECRRISEQGGRKDEHC